MPCLINGEYYNAFLVVRQLLVNGSAIFNHRQTSVMAAAALIMTSYVASMGLGIVRDRLLVTYFYQCCQAQLDVYYAAFRLPDLVFQLIVIGALSAAFIPVFSNLLDEDSEEAFRVASTVANLLMLVFVIFGGAVWVFARPLSFLITGSFTVEQIELMVRLTRWMLAAQFFFLLSSLVTGMIQSHQRFLVPALAPVVYNLGIIGGIVFLSGKLGVLAPAVGVVLGALGHLVIQVPLLMRLGFKYFPKIDVRSSHLREIVRLMLPRTLSLAVKQIEATVVVWLATSLSAGSLTIFYLASQLMQLPVRLVGTPMGQAALPALSREGRKKTTGFGRGVNQGLLQILYLVLPATAILLVLRVPVIRIAFGARAFPWQATLLTGRTLAVFSLAIPAQAAVQFLTRSFWALKDTRIPLKVSLVTALVYVAVSLWLTLGRGWGVLGLAWATSVSSLLQAVLLLGLLYRLPQMGNWRELAGPLSKMSVAAGVTAVCLWLPMRLLDARVFDTTRVVPLLALTLVAGLAGVGVYLLMGRWFELPQQKVLSKLLGRLSQAKKLLRESEEILEPPMSPPVPMG